MGLYSGEYDAGFKDGSRAGYELAKREFLAGKMDCSDQQITRFDNLWLIQLQGDHLKSRGIWERPGHAGYTNDLAKAGVFSEDEARRVEAMAPHKYRAVKFELPQQARQQNGQDSQKGDLVE